MAWRRRRAPQNLGYHLAQKKKTRVLVVDMDPQGSLTTFMGLEPDELDVSVYDAIVNSKPLPVHSEAINGVSLVPADINLAAAELQRARRHFSRIPAEECVGAVWSLMLTPEDASASISLFRNLY